MAMDAAMIERLIKESLPDAQVSIEDLRGDGDHYAAHVVSGAFRGKSRVQQHQMVFRAKRTGELVHNSTGNARIFVLGFLAKQSFFNWLEAAVEHRFQ